MRVFEKLPACLVGIEARATSQHWSRALQALGQEVRLMPAPYVKAYVRSAESTRASGHTHRVKAGQMTAPDQPCIDTGKTRANKPPATDESRHSGDEVHQHEVHRKATLCARWRSGFKAAIKRLPQRIKRHRIVPPPNGRVG
jgi:transposase